MRSSPRPCLQTCSLDGADTMQALLQIAGHMEKLCKGKGSRVVLVKHAEDDLHILHTRP